MNTHEFRVPKKSLLPIITILCSAAMLFLTFFTFGFDEDKFRYYFHFPFGYYGDIFTLFFSFLRFIGILMFFIFSIFFAKKNSKLFIIPISLFFFFLFCLATYNFLYYSDFPSFKSFFSIITNLSVLALFTLTVTYIIKTKWPFVIVCFFLIPVELIFMLIDYIDYYTFVTDNYYISFYFINILWYVGIGFLALAFKKVKKINYKQLVNVEAVNIQKKQRAEFKKMTEYKVPKKSVFLIVTIVCSALMLFFAFFDFGIYGGKFGYNFYIPINTKVEIQYSIFNTLDLISIITLLIFSVFVAKKNIKLLIIPVVLVFFFKLVYYFYSEISFYLEYNFYVFLLKQALPSICLLVVLIFFTLAVTNIIDKLPAAVICFAVVFMETIFLLTGYSKYTPIRTMVFLASYASYVLYYIGIGFLLLSLKKLPKKEYSEKAEEVNLPETQLV